MRVLTFAILLLAAAASAVAQQPAAAPPPASGGEPDIAILATVHARELRFDEKPDVRTSVWGEVNGRPAATVSTTDRQNLPPEVQPYVTYRDIGILLTITSTLPDIETILDEALGTAPPAPAPATTQKPAAKPRRKSRR